MKTDHIELQLKEGYFLKIGNTDLDTRSLTGYSTGYIVEINEADVRDPVAGVYFSGTTSSTLVREVKGDLDVLKGSIAAAKDYLKQNRIMIGWKETVIGSLESALKTIQKKELQKA